LKVKANERTEERLGEPWSGQCHPLGTADIKGKRLKLTPVDPNDMRALIDMGYVEIQNDAPVVTSAGFTGSKLATEAARAAARCGPAGARSGSPAGGEAPANGNASTYREEIWMENALRSIAGAYAP
jgi:hypothetical protein